MARIVLAGLALVLLVGCASQETQPTAAESASPSPELTESQSASPSAAPAPATRAAPTPTPATSAPPELAPSPAPAPASALANAPLQICDFGTPDAASPNPDYPFDFLLTTELANSADPNVQAAVTSVQEVLRRAGFTGLTGAPTLVDGSYGPNTAHAIKTFQQQAGLIVDGAVGQQTWQALGAQYCWYFH